MNELGALLSRELRMVRSSWVVAVVYLVLPLLVMSFTHEAFAAVASAAGVPSNESDQAVIGQTAMFGIMLLSQLGYSFFEEHSWGTWDRLRASPAGMVSIVGAKLAVNWLHQSVQATVLVIAGTALFDLRFGGSALAVAAAIACSAFAVVALGFFAVAAARTNAQYNVFCYLGALSMAGCGGALVPPYMLPDWARDVGTAFPTYWSMQAMSSALTGGGWSTSVTRGCAVLAAMGLGGLAAGAAIFRPGRRRRSYA